MASLGPGRWSAPVAVFARRALGSASKPIPTAGPWERVRAAGVSVTGTLPLAPVPLLGGMKEVMPTVMMTIADENVHEFADEER